MTVIEQQVDEELLALHVQPVLTPHEGEPPTHLDEEFLNTGHDRPFQFSFVMFLAKFEEAKGVFILHRQLGLMAVLLRNNLVEVGLVEERLLVGLVLDLVDEHVLRPPELAGHADVELPFKGVLALLQNGEIMAPAYFSHQWCEFFGWSIRFHKQLHSPEIRGRETVGSRKLLLKIGGEGCHYGLAPAFAFLPLDDHPPDVPIEGNEFLVDGLQCRILGRPDTFLDLRQQNRITFRGDCRHCPASISFSTFPAIRSSSSWASAFNLSNSSFCSSSRS